MAKKRRKTEPMPTEVPDSLRGITPRPVRPPDEVDEENLLRSAQEAVKRLKARQRKTRKKS